MRPNQTRRGWIFLTTILSAVVLSNCGLSDKGKRAPFTLDSLMTFNHAQLVKIVGKGNLKDSLTDNRYLFTTLYPGTKLQVLLQWEDTTAKVSLFATVKGDAEGANLWKTNDSLFIGMKSSALERLNKAPFQFWYRHPASGTSPGSVVVWGDDGALSNQWHVVTLNARFSADTVSQPHLYSSDSELAYEYNPIIIEIRAERPVPPMLKVENFRMHNAMNATVDIPHVTARHPSYQKSADSINRRILDVFQIHSFDAGKTKPHFGNIKTDVAFDRSVIMLHITAAYVSSSPGNIDKTILYDFETNQPRTVELPFRNIFAWNQYNSFTSEYWSPGCLKKMAAAANCAKIAPSCGCDDILVATTNDKITLTLNNQDCFPRASEACSPVYKVTLPIETIRPYLSDYGKGLVFQSRYYTKSDLRRYHILSDAAQTAPNNFHVRLSLNISEPNQIQTVEFEVLADSTIRGIALIEGASDKPTKLTGTFNSAGFTLIGDGDWGFDGGVRFLLNTKATPGSFPIGGWFLTAFQNNVQIKVLEFSFTSERLISVGKN